MAGGSAVFNPEPMADFIDFFVIGEGEQVILEIVEAYREVRDADRETQLRRMAQVPGVYVPRFYAPAYFEDGTLRQITPRVGEAEPRIVKRITPVMPPPVTRFIVPFVDVVFNRASIEIQRGCTRGCRFCQAGMIFRPVRERSMQEIIDTVDAIVRETGYAEISLLSLSSTDYTTVGPLVKELSERYRDRNLSLSLPSSRVESVSVDLVGMLAQGRKTGFTFAPEAATDRMRDVINKSIPTQELLEVADTVYGRGWRLIKLYFMIGQPTETEEDVRAIARVYLPYLAVLPLIGCAAFMLDGIFVGATRSRDMRNMMALSFAVYVVSVGVLVPFIGNNGLWLSMMISFVARALTLGVRYPALERAAAG